jgi:mannose-6-phosphate isomerase-like protein (cupin superfamily)
VTAVEKVNLEEKLGKFRELWDPKIVAQVNNVYVKLVKLKGEFVWHRHEDEDELFLVLHGRMTVQMRGGDVSIREGELVVVPRGVEHRPVAKEETAVLLLEPTSTLNTGNVRGPRTRADLDRI